MAQSLTRNLTLAALALTVSLLNNAPASADALCEKYAAELYDLQRNKIHPTQTGGWNNVGKTSPDTEAALDMEGKNTADGCSGIHPGLSNPRASRDFGVVEAEHIPAAPGDVAEVDGNVYTKNFKYGAVDGSSFKGGQYDSTPPAISTPYKDSAYGN